MPCVVHTDGLFLFKGCGHFTIVDGNKVDSSDFNNFFIDHSAIGQSRAVVTTALLSELNDRVRGSALEKDPVELINTDINYFKQFSVIIANNLPEDSVLRIAKVSPFICDWGCHFIARTRTRPTHVPARTPHYIAPRALFCSHYTLLCVCTLLGIATLPSL